jgi:hypothetical protein
MSPRAGPPTSRTRNHRPRRLHFYCQEIRLGDHTLQMQFGRIRHKSRTATHSENNYFSDDCRKHRVHQNRGRTDSCPVELARYLSVFGKAASAAIKADDSRTSFKKTLQADRPSMRVHENKVRHILMTIRSCPIVFPSCWMHTAPVFAVDTQWGSKV